MRAQVAITSAVISAGVLKRAKRDAAAEPRRESRYRKVGDRRLVTQKTSRRTNELFGVKALAVSRRIGDRIGQPVVHRREPRGVRIAEPTDLDRSGLMGEDEEPASATVTTKIHQHVDLGRL